MDSTGSVKSDAFQRFGKELIAGGIAGALGKSSVAPLERVKILIQTGKSPYTRVDHVLQYIYRSDGVPGFFRGNGASVVRIIPYAALHYASYEYYRTALISALQHAGYGHVTSSRPPVWVDLLAGSCSGATAVAITYPLDLMRTRLAWNVEAKGHGHPHNHTHTRGPLHSFAHPLWLGRRGILETMRAIVEEEGTRGLYRGCVPTLLGILPYAGIKFFTYQSLKRMWLDRHTTPAPQQQTPNSPHGPTQHLPQQLQKPPIHMSLLFGGSAGLVAQTLTYPLDIVRRRMQVANLSATGAGTHATILGTVRAIMREYGWRGLFRGVSINYIKVTPATAVGFTVYDQLKVMLGLENHL